MRRIFIIVALIFFLIGVILASYSTQISHIEEIEKWNIGFCTIRPQDPGCCWGREMSNGTFFELNISASNTVRIKIGVPVYDEVENKIVLKNIIFNRVGINFTQIVEIRESGTYQVEIKNEGTNAVNISGSVSAKKAIYRTVYPYLSLATPILFGSLISLTYGIFAKTEKRNIKMKHKRRKKL